MTKESKVNSVYDWVQDMTVPLRSVKSDQLCHEPESLDSQIDKMKIKVIDEESLIRRFKWKYPDVYSSFIIEQRRGLLEFIKVYTENHEGK